MQDGPPAAARPAAGRTRAYRSVLLPVVGVAILLVVMVVSGATVAPVKDWTRSWSGSTALALLMLVGYGAAVGVLGATPAASTRFRVGQWLPSVVATAPIAFVLLLGGPAKGGTLLAGFGAWGALVVSLVLLKATSFKAASFKSVPWPLRAAALGAPSWLLALVAALYLAVSGSPQSVADWLLPAQVGVVIAGVVAVPGILVVESIDAFGGEGWVGQWLAPESYGRAWVALAVKGAATAVLILILASQGLVLGGWIQSAIVALIVILLLALDSLVSFNDLSRGEGIGGRIRISVTTAMAAMGVLFGTNLLVLACRRPGTLVGLVLVSVVATFMPASARLPARIISVTLAGGVAALAWAFGPTVGPEPSPDVPPYALPAIVIVFLAVVLAQVFLAIRAKQWGFPVLVVAIAAGPLMVRLTHETPGVVPVNLFLLPVLALAMFLGRSPRMRLIDAGEVIRWSVLSLLVIDLAAAASLATGLLQAAFLALTLLTLGVAPLVLNRHGRPRIRAAGLVCAVFTALLAFQGVGVRLVGPSASLLELLDSLASAFFWMIVFPVSAALTSASARREANGPPLPAE